MIDAVVMNARKPQEDEYGRAMLERMNEHHRQLHSWALEHVALDVPHSILDVGFGGGQNIHNLLALTHAEKICGIDYSSASYQKCLEVNRQAVESGRVELCQGSADALPYEADSFDLVTAFETIYYWPSIDKCFQGICRCLRKGGRFLICNEDSSAEGNEELIEALNLNYYSCDELEHLLTAAGFSAVHTYTHHNGKWICAVAER